MLRQDATSDVAFTITMTIGGVALVSLIGLYLKYRNDKKKKEKDGGE